MAAVLVRRRLLAPLPVLAGRLPGPTLETAMERARLGKAQVLGDVLDRQLAMQQVVLGQFAAQFVEGLLVAAAGLLQVALQGAYGHAELLRHPFLARQAVLE